MRDDLAEVERSAGTLLGSLLSGERRTLMRRMSRVSGKSQHAHRQRANFIKPLYLRRYADARRVAGLLPCFEARDMMLYQ